MSLIFDRSWVDANALVITLVPTLMAIFLGKRRVTRALRDPVAIASNHVHTRALWNLAAPLEMGEANGHSDDQMPRDGTRHSHGHRRRSQELRGHAGFFRACILSDLSDRARVVRQGSLGVRSGAAPTTRRSRLNSTNFGDVDRAGPPSPFLSSSPVERTWRPSCPGHLAVVRRPPPSSRR
jgi:hypothetical protein